NRRVYVCTDGGFFHFDFDLHGPEPTISSEPTKWHDGRCLSVTAKYGAVGVSCGDDGLFASWPLFERHQPHRMKLVDTRSLRANWFIHDLINYRSVLEPEVLKTERKRSEEVEGERHAITDIGQRRLTLDLLFGEM